MILRRALLVVAAAALLGARQEKTPATAPSVMMKTLEAELGRAFEKLKAAGESPVYYLCYRVYETESISVSATYGALDSQRRGDKSRTLDVELRVGSPQLDNTHKIRDEGWDPSDRFGRGFSPMPLEDDENSIRNALWMATDAAYKSAQKRYVKVKANKAVKVEEEDTSADFSVEKPVTYTGPAQPFAIDKPGWETRLRKLSLIYRDTKEVLNSSFSFSAVRTRRWLVNNEGSRIQDERVQYRLFTVVDTVADDGMELSLYDGIEAATPAALPGDAKLEELAKTLARQLGELRAAPVADTFAGPAILKSRASGVIFHEIFGHRIEGHRQKDEDEGRTFAKKIGQSIMPDFITVVDDPPRQALGETPLNGHYLYDDEGVPAQKVSLVEKGILRSFLMGRSPVKNFPTSNGHGRCSPGNAPVARQGNLVVDSSKRVPYAKLREMLIEEIKKQGKTYGLIFDDIAGGFTMTQSFMPQSFKLLPLRVWRVYPDGKPDEVLRGVDIVGTPLASLEKILCAADDDDVFNGTCGAESGWVPVSACSPSLLVGTIEVERQQKSQDRPPLLPAPRHDPEDPSKQPPAKDGKKEGQP
ncbi:MAG TPA: TldD/PmbA family protein [Planctomycetota bacterium]|nr:TldD/PmbA family protein [Planctomycetota bacterium]